jgi:hypothetical protein
MENQMIVRKEGGIVQCRICGLMFVPEVEEDRERHAADQRRIICGGMPYDVRELLKRAGWEAAEDSGENQSARETGKRAVVFGWWMRALWNGIPENDCDRQIREREFNRRERRERKGEPPAGTQGGFNREIREVRERLE